MIGKLKGTATDFSPPFLILDVAGIGFLVQTSLTTFNHIREGEEIILYTKCLIKEDETFMYGFLQKEELGIFEDLISVSGVGPKSALNFLSRFTPEEISSAVEQENLALLSSVPKIGKKLASKIVLELKGKLKFETKPSVMEQAAHALCSLGLSRTEAIERLKGLPATLSLEELVRRALKK
jgi:Holliday junction DNA helicase RuvA